MDADFALFQKFLAFQKANLDTNDSLTRVVGQVEGLKLGGGHSDVADLNDFGVVDDGSASGSSSVAWSDLVEEEEEMKAVKVKRLPVRERSAVGGPSVVMPGGKGVGVSAPVNFFAVENDGFYKTYVRTHEVRALERWLRGFGVKIGKRFLEELAMARFSQANLPVAFKGGKERLKVLAKVGDNIMTTLLSDHCYYRSMTVQEVQQCCSKELATSSLSRLCVKSGLASFVSFPSGIDLESSKPAGEALEAVAGVVFHSQGIEGVKVFMKLVGLLD